MEEAIRNRDFASFARLTCADSNQFHAVCLDTSPPIFYMNDTSHRHDLLYHKDKPFILNLYLNDNTIESIVICDLSYIFLALIATDCFASIISQDNQSCWKMEQVWRNTTGMHVQLLGRSMMNTKQLNIKFYHLFGLTRAQKSFGSWFLLVSFVFY